MAHRLRHSGRGITVNAEPPVRRARRRGWEAFWIFASIMPAATAAAALALALCTDASAAGWLFLASLPLFGVLAVTGLPLAAALGLLARLCSDWTRFVTWIARLALAGTVLALGYAAGTLRTDGPTADLAVGLGLLAAVWFGLMVALHLVRRRCYPPEARWIAF